MYVVMLNINICIYLTKGYVAKCIALQKPIFIHFIVVFRYTTYIYLIPPYHQFDSKRESVCAMSYGFS